MSELLLAYEDFLKIEKQASANTVSSYLRDVNQFATAMDGRGVDLTQVVARDVEDYANSLVKRGKSPATVTRSVASIKSFYTCLIGKGYVGQNPAKGVAPARVERKLPQVLTSKEVELFLEQPECTDLKGYRDRAMLELLYATGIRVSELRFFTVEAVRLGRAEVSNKGKNRTVFLPEKLRKALLQYAQAQKIAAGPVFVTRNGKPLDRSNIWHDMKALCREAGVADSKGFPHNLRHLFARTYYALEKDIVRLADILGHSSINTTRIYTMESGAVHRRQLEKMRLVI